MTTEAGPARQRIDKWLWFARLAKTRTAAQKLATSGGVRVNRERNTSASRPVAPGDVLTVATPRAVRVLKVVAPGTRRGPASEAATLYEDLTPAPAPDTQAPASGGPAQLRGGRPSKRDRRAIAALKRSWDRDTDPSGG